MNNQVDKESNEKFNGTRKGRTEKSIGVTENYPEAMSTKDNKKEKETAVPKAKQVAPVERLDPTKDNKERIHSKQKTAASKQTNKENRKAQDKKKTQDKRTDPANDQKEKGIDNIETKGNKEREKEIDQEQKTRRRKFEVDCTESSSIENHEQGVNVNDDMEDSITEIQDKFNKAVAAINSSLFQKQIPLLAYRNYNSKEQMASIKSIDKAMVDNDNSVLVPYKQSKKYKWKRGL